MRRDERVHERLKVGAPPLRKAVPDVPVPLLLALAEAADGGQALVKALLEPLDLVVFGPEVVTRQLEEGVRYLQHQNVRVIVLVADEDALASAAHSMGCVVLLEASQAGEDGGVLLGLRLFDAKRVVGERVEADGRRLRGIEVEG